jgi:hypothetical protein
MGTTPQLTGNVYGLSVYVNNCINNGKSQGGHDYEEFALFVEDVQHVINRNPSVFALPGIDQDSHGLPKIYSIDFGMLEETIILSGAMADEENNPYLPTVHDMMRIGRTWWSAFSLSGADTTGFNRLLLQTSGAWNDVNNQPVGDGNWSGEVYGFTFQNITTSRTAGQLEWGYKMTLAVVKFPQEDEPGGASGGLKWMKP